MKLKLFFALIIFNYSCSSNDSPVKSNANLLTNNIWKKIHYKQIKYFLNPVLQDYINNFHNELDFDDLSGETWTASISVRTLTRRETEQLILQGAEVFAGPQQGETFEIRYDGELKENEVCDFDWPLMNMKPDMDKLMKIKKRK